MKSENEHNGILENLYFQSLGKQAFDTFSPFILNPKTKDILESFEELIKDYPPDLLEKLGEVPEELWQGLKKIGLFGLNIHEKYGGKGLALDQYHKVIETIARKDLALSIIPTAHLSIGIKGILLFGNEEQKNKYLPLAATGEMIFAYALTEPDRGSDAQHIETRADLSEDGRYYILNGLKTYITNGGYAKGLTVFAQLDPDKPGQKMGAFIVETGWEGVEVGSPMPKMGLTISSTTLITFTNVKVPIENLLGEPGDGFKIAMTILNYGRLGLGAVSIGVMRQALEDMIERASTRIQFGVPIDHFELIQEKIVQARVARFATEVMTSFTAHLLENTPSANVAVESSHTKLFGTTRGWDSLYDALQVAGGAGYLSTLPYEKRMRDFRVATIFEGTTEIHSIYPAVHLLRSLARVVQKKGESKLKQIFLVLTGVLKGPHVPLEIEDAAIKEARSFVEKSVKKIRFLLCRGLAANYGKKDAGKQFFLRRITRLSLDVYAIICMMAKIYADRRLGHGNEIDTKMLAYFVTQAKESFKKNRRYRERKSEELHQDIFELLAR